MDDHGVERCDPGVHENVLSLYSVPSIEALNQQQVWVRRVFFVDGYGRDVVLISFLRRPDEPPELEVVTPLRDDGTRWPVMRAVVPPETWNRILSEDRFFDRELVEPTQEKREDLSIVICIHSWVYTVEASDPERRQLNTAGAFEPPQIRRDVEDACSNGLGEQFATILSEHASDLLPYCAPHDADYFRNSVTRIAACAVLTGDRMTAGKLLKAAQILDSSPRYFGDDIRRLFGTSSRLHRPDDDPGSEGARAATAWAALFPDNSYGFTRFSRIHGENADRAVMEGRIVHQGEIEHSDRVRYFEAPVVLRWAREFGDLRIVDAEVGVFVETSSPFRR